MAFRSAASASSAAGGTLTATPAGVAAHDYLAGFFVCDLNGHSVTQPTAWNSPTNLDQAAPDGQTFRFSDKNDASGSDAFGWASDGTFVAVINAAWSGRDNTTPRSTAPIVTNNLGSGATPVSASFTGITATLNDDIAAFMATDQDSATGRWTFSTIASYTERIDGITVDWVSGLALDTRDAVSAGATGALASTITRGSGTGNVGYAGIVVAIKVAAGGATAWGPLLGLRNNRLVAAT